MERTVDVWGKPHVVTLWQRSKSAWIATGETLGQHVEVQGRSAGYALARWRDAARYRTG